MEHCPLAKKSVYTYTISGKLQFCLAWFELACTPEGILGKIGLEMAWVWGVLKVWIEALSTHQALFQAIIIVPPVCYQLLRHKCFLNIVQMAVETVFCSNSLTICDGCALNESHVVPNWGRSDNWAKCWTWDFRGLLHNSENPGSPWFPDVTALFWMTSDHYSQAPSLPW